MDDYQRIARIIRYLDDHQTEQPDLTTLASHAGLSPYHLHRLFSRWAAITPKDFLQCLTQAHARQLLRQGHTVLDSSLGAGLSGPGRLHDLSVGLDAASPGEIKSGGAGWTVTFGFATSPFGLVLLAESPRGICHLSFVESTDDQALAILQVDWPRARLLRDDETARQWVSKIFARVENPASGAGLRAYVRGTPFQLLVWRALLQIPAGRLVSYGWLAKAVGEPDAARAVGRALAQNPLAFLIPCHRVIRETGIFGNYRWGRERKRAMLIWESAELSD